MNGQLFIDTLNSIPLYIMIFPIFLASVILLAVFIERTVYFSGIRYDYRTLIHAVLDEKRRGNDERIAHLLDLPRGPVAEMIGAALQLERGGARERLLRDRSDRALKKTERFAPVVATISTVAPMLGLLGTVTGMMKSFGGLAQSGPAARDILARGLTEALVTTALGLVVAIPALVYYNYLVTKVENTSRDIEYVANALLEE